MLIINMRIIKYNNRIDFKKIENKIVIIVRK